MKTIKAIIASLALFAMFAGTSAQAKVEIQWWHAFGGRLGDLLDEQVNKFNASQDKYTVVHTRIGNYSETLNAGIAAFRAKQHPNLYGTVGLVLIVVGVILLNLFGKVK